MCTLSINRSRVVPVIGLELANRYVFTFVIWVAQWLTDINGQSVVELHKLRDIGPANGAEFT